jgi:hypothetical protein
MRKSPPEQLSANHCTTQSQSQDKSIAQNQDESILPDQEDDTPDQENGMLFCKSCLLGPSKYETDCIFFIGYLSYCNMQLHLRLIPYRSGTSALLFCNH